MLKSVIDGDFAELSKEIDDFEKEDVPTTTFFSTRNKNIILIFYV